MNRRRSIKRLAVAAGALITLPQWMISCGVTDTETHATSFSSAQQAVLAAIAGTIIPAGTNAPGALTVGVDKFLQKLFDDCFEKEVQSNIRTQLEQLNKTAESQYKKSFSACKEQERQDMLMNLANSPKKEEKDFFTLIKTETIRGFTTSQKVMQDYLGYKVAPGHYYGCVDVKA